MTSDNHIARQLNLVNQQIREAEQRFNRPQDSVQLIAVSKTKPVSDIRAAYAAGQRVFGENYVQEALNKIKETSDLDLQWHYIGPIQSNKTKDLAAHMDWVHTIDREKIARRLNDQRPDSLPKLNVCIQVNISEEQSKSGVLREDAMALANDIDQMKRLALRGLMAIPEPSHSFEDQRKSFAQLAALKDQINAKLGLSLDTLSMGMSNDMDAAIAEGSTMVRIGTAIFGARNYDRTS